LALHAFVDVLDEACRAEEAAVRRFRSASGGGNHIAIEK
jgi:hypothetical protein